MQQCMTCHDGKTAFLAVGTTCTTCHKGGPDKGASAPPAIPVPPIRFPHAAHQQQNVQIGNCSTCHELDSKTFAALPGAGANHLPCASCHQQEFLARSPRICGACHDDARPWTKAVLVALAGPTEFGHDFSHRAHVKDLGAKDNGFCQRCHQGRFQAAPVAQSHATCAPCHASDAAPRMTECGGCHQLGQSMGALAPRDASYEWYVRGTFDHELHAKDPRSGQATSCLLCHDQVAGASRLAEIGRPRMQQCDACHDGKVTFKTTGFGCARCHRPAGGVR
jgi:c(7)-type cytochrome triheme protein